ncbi:hypothetical protein WIS52_09895 [Pseudonocardia nematodicida]|uniref:Uncharacterized protein n=1 Tax=Pseudonocardia nematodicida TaxID=1206997 RepID=A0ABV1KAA1_9PSEU
MTSLGELRSALATVTERTDLARGHVETARHRLDEIGRIYTELSASSRETLPAPQVERARRELDDLLSVIATASGAVADLDARL